jgi:hypothetical protein
MTEFVNAGIVPLNFTVNTNNTRFKQRTDNYLNMMQCPVNNYNDPVSECQDLLNYAAISNYFNQNCINNTNCSLNFTDFFLDSIPVNSNCIQPEARYFI